MTTSILQNRSISQIEQTEDQLLLAEGLAAYSAMEFLAADGHLYFLPETGRKMRKFLVALLKYKEEHD